MNNNRIENLGLKGGSSSTTISDSVTKRHKNKEYYTFLNNCVLLSTNPSSEYSEDELLSYSKRYYKLESTEPLPPSVFELATRSYYQMRRLGQDQSFIVTSNNEYQRLVVQLFFLSKNLKKQEQIYTRNVSIDYFANTFINSNGTGMHKQFSFNNRGRLDGIKTNFYSFSASLRNFDYNIFGQIINNKSQELKNIDFPSINLRNKHKYFKTTVEHLKNLGFKANTRENVFELISAILKILFLEFDNQENQLYLVDNSYHQYVMNVLGIGSNELEQIMCFKQKTINGEKCSVIVTENEALALRDNFASSMYYVLIEWMLKNINERLQPSDCANTIDILTTIDSYEFENDYEKLCYSMTNEKINNFVMHYFTSRESDLFAELSNENIKSYPVQAEISDLLTQISRDIKINHHSGPENIQIKLNKKYGGITQYKSSPPKANSFTIKSYSSEYEYEYDLQDIIQNINNDSFTETMKKSSNEFIRTVYTSTTLNKEKHQSLKEERSLQRILNSLKDNQIWTILSLRVGKTLLNQISSLQLSNISKNSQYLFDISFTFQDFKERYRLLLNNEQIQSFLNTIIGTSEYKMGNTKVFITNKAWKTIEDELKLQVKQEKQLGSSVCSPKAIDSELFYSTVDSYNGFNQGPRSSCYASEKEYGNQDNVNTTQNDKAVFEQINNVQRNVTPTRKIWVTITWMLTWWIPSILLSICGMKTKDVQMAWREKVTICLLIFFSWVLILFVNIVLGLLLCPSTKVYKPSELTGLQNYDLGVFMYGKVYNISRFAKTSHGKNSKVLPRGVDQTDMEQFGGKDITFMFPFNLDVACSGLVTDDKTVLKYNNTEEYNPAFIHSSTNIGSDISDKAWLVNTGLKKLKSMQIAEVVHDSNDIKKARLEDNTPIAYINKKVYDLSPYFYTKDYPGQSNFGFLPQEVEQVFKDGSFGPDLTNIFNTKLSKLSNKQQVMRCLNNVFFVGNLDPRKEVKCQLTNYLLIAFSGIAIFVTLVKFLAALQLGGRREPIESNKFVIFQVPCYTEGEESIKRTIDSLALLDYKDNQKLLFLIADGMITGSGNEKSTPQIILETLGVDPSENPAAKEFKSVAEGQKQLNKGKVYSGFYQIEGRSVPYIVVIKVGNNSETNKPGNRGKRDSQIVLMNFLSRVHYNEPMCALEHDIYFHINNNIGIDPRQYEFILMVDADTMVEPDSLTRLCSVMIRDSRIIGLCGETQIYDQNKSIVTMGQVYEYYISHNLAKSFESLFGSVTCLPGCFSMYRIKSTKNQPLIIHRNIIKDYSENKVDTLHKKNLLHLGEDRYLTTLIIKNFPLYKTKFIPDALCKTVVPEKFNILLSQRRRWINSTIHNFFELVMLKDMCGFCCFSMRFVVFLDLIGTLLLPASVIYLFYVIIAASTKIQIISTESIIMMCAVYILQALVFIIKRKWEHIGWMFIYILGIFFFNFYIPIYSFWHFDDFSWGNTRKITGNGKEKVIKEDVGTFDPTQIPLTKLEDFYDQEKSEVLPMDFNNTPNFNKSYFTSSPDNRISSFGSGSFNRYSINSHNANNIQQKESNSIVPVEYSSYQFGQLNRFPNDEDIIIEIKSILSTTNLMSITKKQLRERLSVIFQIDMTPKKDFINECVDLILAGRM